jgi:hypothetical protein
MPTIGGSERPSDSSVAPANWPWLDSTRPIAATSVHGMPQSAATAASW